MITVTTGNNAQQAAAPAQPASQPAQEASQAGKVALAILALAAGIAIKLIFVLLEMFK